MGEAAAREILGSIQERWDHFWQLHFAGAEEAIAAAGDITQFNLDHGLPVGRAPIFIPRNHMLQRAITSAERDGDLGPYFELLRAVTDPFNPAAGPEWMKGPEGDELFVTYCGT